MPQPNCRQRVNFKQLFQMSKKKELNKTHESRALSMHNEQADDRITIFHCTSNEIIKLILSAVNWLENSHPIIKNFYCFWKKYLSSI